MSAPRRYAEGTIVTVESSRGEITGILAKHGVARMGWTTEPEQDVLMFELGGGSYRFNIKRPTAQSLWEVWKADGRSQLKYLPNEAQVQAEWRRRWRANVLLLKAKLEFIDSGDTTLDRELLPYRVLKNGSTIEEVLIAGGLPMLTAGAR